MPLTRCTKNGKKGWKWGESGKCYIGKNAKENAIKQMLAIGGGEMPKDINEDTDILDEMKVNNKAKTLQKGITSDNKVDTELDEKLQKDSNDIFHIDVFDETKLSLTEKAEYTPEGFLKGRAIVTNTGIFRYMTRDGEILNELRTPEEVFDINSLKTIRNLPITDNHPKEMITSENISELQKKGIIIGNLGSRGLYDMHAVSIDYVITNKEAIEKIESGEQSALSMGYTAKLDFEEGYAFGNNPYNAIQRDIQYNHVALVDRGRAGDLAKITMDSNCIADNTVIQVIDTKEKGGNNMSKETNTAVVSAIKVDGIDYEVDRDIAKHILLQTQKIDSLETNIKELTAAKDAFETEIETLKKQVEESKNIDVSKEVQERIKLEKIADYVEVNHDGVENKTLKVAIINKRNEKIDLADKDEIYINAYFDSIKDIIQDEISKGSVNDQKKTVLSRYTEDIQPYSKQDMYQKEKEKLINQSKNYKGSAYIENGRAKTN